MLPGGCFQVEENRPDWLPVIMRGPSESEPKPPRHLVFHYGQLVVNPMPLLRESRSVG
jgi:hypothetical protein